MSSSTESIKVSVPKSSKSVKTEKSVKAPKEKVLKEKKIIVEEKVLCEEKPVQQSAEVPVCEEKPVQQSAEVPISAQEKISLQISSVSSMIKTLKGIEGNLKEATKTMHKESKSKKRVLSPEEKEKRRATSGFNKPTGISSELALFMGLADGSQASRVDVTRAIVAYIKENNLQNGRQFKVDDKLKALLGEAAFPINSKQPELGLGYTYFNVPSYLKKHFLKKE